MAVALGAVLTLSYNPKSARAIECHAFWDVEEDDSPLPPDVFHAKQGSDAEFPDADPFGGGEFGEPKYAGSFEGQVHNQWVSGPTAQEHDHCGS